jgi:predicted amidophosphoribosyltransferase
VSRQLPPGVQEIGRALEAEAGTYLHSTVRESGVTCSVCSAPVDGYPRCVPCNGRAGSGLALADRVGSLIYAVEPESQAYRVVRNYKAALSGASLHATMRALLALGLRGHFSCAAKLSALVTHGWAVVPSTRGRTALHDLVAGLSQRSDAEVPVRFVGMAGSREMRPAEWQIDTAVPIPGHVVLVDDSWVTGAHSQAVACALKSAGAGQVSIFTVARVLDPRWPANENFIKTRFAGSGFDWTRCPWTGGDCP